MSNQEWNSRLTTDEKIFLLIALFFFCTGVILIISIFVSRIVKSSRQERQEYLRDYFQQVFNSIIILETTTTVPTASYQFNVESLGKVARQSGLAKQVLISQLILIKKSLTGSSSRVLEKLFMDLGLHHYSLKKLRSISWKIKAQGIRELTELNYEPSVEKINGFLHSRNKTLREEAFMAKVRLQKEKPLAFLNEYTGELTPWMRMNIHIHLSKMDTRQLPDFSQWFGASNPDVVLFAISMARQFRQSSSIYAMANVLQRPEHAIVALAIETIGDFEAYEMADKVAALSSYYRGDEKISARLVRCLGRTGHTDEHRQLVEGYLDHPDYTVRFNAVQALISLDPEAITSMNPARKEALSGIIRHVSEPLLQ